MTFTSIAASKWLLQTSALSRVQPSARLKSTIVLSLHIGYGTDLQNRWFEMGPNSSTNASFWAMRKAKTWPAYRLVIAGCKIGPTADKGKSHSLMIHSEGFYQYLSEFTTQPAVRGLKFGTSWSSVIGYLVAPTYAKQSTLLPKQKRGLTHGRCLEGTPELTFMTKVVFLMSMGNWSVSQPRSGEPVFESTEPSMPSLSIKQRWHVQSEQRHSAEVS